MSYKGPFHAIDIAGTGNGLCGRTPANELLSAPAMLDGFTPEGRFPFWKGGGGERLKDRTLNRATIARLAECLRAGCQSSSAKPMPENGPPLFTPSLKVAGEGALIPTLTSRMCSRAVPK